MIHALLMVVLFAMAQATTFRVSGTVVREDQQDPAAAAQANQIRISGPSTSIVTIGAGGTFEFSNLRPGTYQIVVGPRITMPPQTIVVSDRDLTGVRVFVPLTVEVSGTVSVEGNAPRPRFQLSFTRVDAPATAPVTITSAATFRTPLPAGEYRMTAGGLPSGYILKSATAGNADALNQGFRVAQGAQPPISVLLSVSSPSWVRVRGRVIGGSAPSVSLIGVAMADTLEARVAADGVFEFPMVLPGNYTLRTVPAVPLASPLPVTVGATDLANVEFRIPASKQVTGKITTRGNMPPPRLIFAVASGAVASPVSAGEALNLVGGVVMPATPGRISIPTNPGPDGSFSVTLPEGEHAISIVPGSIPAGYSVDSFTYGPQDLMRAPLRLALADQAEIAILVNATKVEPRNIRGKVTGLLDTRGVRVVLQGGNLGTGVESSVAPDGSFAFSNVLPGNYSARLSLSGHLTATAVSVGNSDVTNLTIHYPRRFSIAAQVLVEGDGAEPNSIPPIALEARSAGGAVVGSSTTSTSPSPMVLTVSDGEHRILVKNLPAGYAVKSLRYGSVDLQESPLIVDGPIAWEIIVRLVKAER